MTAAILCNGLFPTEPYPLWLLDSADVVICCDGAFEKYSAHTDRLPDAVIGDLDSLSPSLQKAAGERLVHVSEQDDNDQTKAVRYVLSHYPEVDEIHILGATGLREDHTVGNMSLLMEYPRMFPLGDIRIDMVSDFGTLFAITDTIDLHVGKGRRFSLFSPDNSLKIKSAGLQWPTDDVVFDNWWKATLNRTTEDIVSLRFSHPSLALVALD